MKRAAGTIFMLILLALLSGMLTMALAAENDEEALAIPEPGEAAELETIEVSGTVDLLQRGSLTGNYTKPDEVSLFADEDTLEQQVYDQIYEGLLAQQESITITRTDLAVTSENVSALQQLVIDSYKKVVNDNPRLFYVNGGYSLSGKANSSIGIQFTLTPSYLASVTEEQIAAFHQAVEEAKAQVAGITDDVEKLLILHDYLVVKNAYNQDVLTTGTSDDKLVWSAYAALVQGDPVCQGYSLAYQLLLNEVGIECITISSASMNHAWNMVQINGSWYHVDVTWDDPVSDKAGYCNHTYFLLSDSAISDHYGWSADLPKCTSTEYESGWVFCESIFPIYIRNGEIYYVIGSGLYKTSALDTTAEYAFAVIASGCGIVWVDDGVYYVPYASTTQRTLAVCSLDSGKKVEVGRFDSAAITGGIGLRYNAGAGLIEVVSNSSRSVVASFPAIAYPLEWDTTADTVAIVGVKEGATAGVVWGGNAPEPSGLTLWAAYYRDGRLVCLRQQEVQGADSVELVTLNMDGLPEYDQFRLMLLTSDWTPVCAAFAPVA